MKLPRLILATAIALHAPAHAQDIKGDMEYVMSEYLRLWNAHDAATIVRDFYRLDPTHRWSTVAGLQSEFDRLKAEGYDHSVSQGITGCVIDADNGQVELRFTRLKTDGSFMPPKDRVSVYKLHRFEEGWRVITISGLPEGQRMICTE